jgi:hypothetical protein
MAHRPDDVRAQAHANGRPVPVSQGPDAKPVPTVPGDSVTVRLVDVEPVAGLVAACARMSTALRAEHVSGWPEEALDALRTIQSLLFGFEHARTESGK